MSDFPISPERALRFFAHEAKRVREFAYAGGAGGGPDRDTLEAALLLLPSILKVTRLPEMDDAEAYAFAYQLKQELPGLNAHDNEA